MPRIFDNISLSLLPALQETLDVSYRADFCVGYFNLRGWRALASCVDSWSNPGDQCRILVGMQRLPHDELRASLSLLEGKPGIDNQAALRLKKDLAEQVRQQLTIGAPTNEDEGALRRLASQLRRQSLVFVVFRCSGKQRSSPFQRT